MQLQHLVKPIEDMTDEELKERLYELRHRREVEKPKVQKAAKKAATKKANKEVSAVDKLLANLPPDQLALILKEMGLDN